MKRFWFVAMNAILLLTCLSLLGASMGAWLLPRLTYGGLAIVVAIVGELYCRPVKP